MKRKDYYIATAFGLIFWAAGVILYKFLANMNLLKIENMLIIFFIATIASIGAIILMDKVLKIKGEKLLPLMSIASATAILLDSVVLVYFPNIYSIDQLQSLYIGAALLNGTATLTLFAVIYHMKFKNKI
jgi:hypothetical protein